MTDKATNEKEKIEELFVKINEYRKSDNFRQMLNFCARFKHLSPYNAWLAQLQMPGARYVLSEEEWFSQYHRIIKPHARPIIILIPFGPISIVFDIGETIAKKNNNSLFDNIPTDDEILAKLEAPYRISQEVSDMILNHLMENLCYSGIKLQYFTAAPSFGAEIRINSDYTLSIPIGNDKDLKVRNDYLISVNSNADKSELFASICHELGHLFCHHLRDPYNKIAKRTLTHAEKEFEAETVSWLVCERHGLKNPSEHYLNYYVGPDGMIPKIKLSLVLQATNEIEHMLIDTPQKALERGFLWKNRSGFKELIKGLRASKAEDHKGSLFSLS